MPHVYTELSEEESNQERTVAVAQSMQHFEAALQGLVADAASGEEAKGEEDRLVLVRVKDRLNTPVEKSGHRDVLINFEHKLTAVRKFETIWPLSH